MIDNSQDKGNLSVTVRETENGLELCESSFVDKPEEFSVFIEYEDGNIFLNDGNKITVFGHYETLPGPFGCKVIDHNTNDVIGYVSEDCIYFCKTEEAPGTDSFYPERECLAYTTNSGRITALNLLTGLGLINGSAVGGAAAFVAFFYNYKISSIFRDYWIMEKAAFKEKHASYFSLSF